MIYMQSLGQSIPSPCEPYTGARITFRSEGLRLTVPNIIEDQNIRWMMDRGKSLVDAYKAAGAGSIIPDAAIRPCISEKLRYRRIDPITGRSEISAPGQFTCAEFHRCFEDYIRAQRAFPEDRPSERRLQIAPGVYAPSAAEDQCIRQKFLMFRNLTQAYHDCGAGDIIPSWPGAAQFISNALTASPDTHLYEITKTAYQLFGVKPKPKPPPISPPPDKKDVSLSSYILIAVGALFLESYLLR